MQRELGRDCKHMYIGRGWQTVDSAPAGMAAQEALAVVCCEVSTLSPICGAEVLNLFINSVGAISLLLLRRRRSVRIPRSTSFASCFATATAFATAAAILAVEAEVEVTFSCARACMARQGWRDHLAAHLGPYACFHHDCHYLVLVCVGPA